MKKLILEITLESSEQIDPKLFLNRRLDYKVKKNEMYDFTEMLCKMIEENSTPSG